LSSGDEETIRDEIADGRPVILLLRLLDAPGRGKDIYHYVVVDGVDPRRDLLRFQFGDGTVRWTTLDPLEKAWRGAGNALLTVRRREDRAALQEGVELERAGRLEEAAGRYRLTLDEDPGSVRAWVNLGNVRSRQGRVGEAEDAYRRALELAPDDTDAQNNLAWLLLESGADLGEAESLARRAAARPGPDRPLALDTLARVLGAAGRCGEAEATFSEALSLTDLSPELRSGLESAQREVRQSCRSAP
jgi:cytochrome c-type biogenesis protein CcmH/NrfG